MERKLKRLIISAAIAVGLSVPAMATDLNLARFFGDCQNAGTDTDHVASSLDDLGPGFDDSSFDI